ncbi:MAG: hypothetical protein DWI28_05345 [Planctomycetota bacterium]|nr:MAG: hypothetical protein DWI28_05345 [Planctomycetota bacterium]
MALRYQVLVCHGHIRRFGRSNQRGIDQLLRKQHGDAQMPFATYKTFDLRFRRSYRGLRLQHRLWNHLLELGKLVDADLFYAQDGRFPLHKHDRRICR